MEIQLYIEKRNTISQKFPLRFVVLRFAKRTQKVTVQDLHKSQKSETMPLEDFEARFAPVP